MNKIFKVIWSKARNCYVVVSELAKSHDDGHIRRSRSGCCRKAAVLAAFVLTTSLAAVPVWAADNKENINNLNDTGNVVYGPGNTADKSGAVIVGENSKGDKDSVVIGNNAQSNAENQIIIGHGTANGSAIGSIIIGNTNNTVDTSQSVLIGNNTKANGSGQGIVIIGNGAIADSNAAGYTDNGKYIPAGIVLGEYSYSNTRAGKDGYLSDRKGDKPSTAFNDEYWNAVWKATANPMAIGNADTDANGKGEEHNGHVVLTRQITGVAAGTDLTDAVNVAQLQAAIAQFSGGGSGTSGDGVHYYSVLSNEIGSDSNYDNKGAKGQNSLAAGVRASTTEKAENAVAIGYGAKAEGKGATVIGQYGEATARYALAFGGQQTDATAEQANNVASGDNSVAFGERTTASGSNSTAFGQGTKATEKRATAFGQQTQATQSNATAFGINTIASGQNATAFGNLTQATEIGATAFGNKNQATGQYATAWGGGDKTVDNGDGTTSKIGTIASGTYATAFGERTVASGESATAFGSDSTAKGNNSLAFGEGSNALGGNSLAGLGGTAAADDSIALGRNAQARSKDTLAIGNGAEALTGKDVAIGYGAEASGNLTDTSTYNYPAIAIGDGTSVKANESVAIGKANVIERADGEADLAGANILGHNNTVKASGVTIVGNNNSVTDPRNHDVMILGNLVTKTTDNSVFLGSGSAYTSESESTKGKSKTYTSDRIGGATLTYAGGTVTSGIVSVGSPDATRRIQNVAPGLLTAASTDAVNGSQLYAVANLVAENTENLKTKGLDFQGNNDVTVHRDLGQKLTIQGEGTKADTNYSGENLKVIGNTDGSLTIKMDKDIKGNRVTVGEKGEPGKDGVDGTIGVNGKDGSAVVINGRDGSIGLNGKDGANGLTIKGDKGKTGVDGTDGHDGKDGMTRIIYEDSNTTKHEVATLDDGLKFHGDSGDIVTRKLNTQLDVLGGQTDTTKLTAASDGNIGVVSTKAADETSNGKLEIRLAKELKGLTSVQTGDTTIDGNGLKIEKAGKDSKGDIIINKTTVSVAGNQITNMGSGLGNTYTTAGDNNGANIGDVKQIADGRRTTVKSTDGSVSVVDKNADDPNATSHDYDLSVDTLKVVEGVTLKYKGDNNTQGSNKLSEAVTFSGTANQIVTEAADGKVTFKLADDLMAGTLTLNGKDGKDGQPGTPGHIGIDGKDGKSGIGIDGKDGISIKGENGTIGLSGKDGISVKGKDGKDGVTITGKDGVDGVNGAEGHIGLNGKDGMVDIWTKPGKPGVDGNDGETMTRIVYKDPNGQEHEAATLDDGLKFGGDFGTASAVKLNKQVNVKGNATTEDDLTDGNIGVVSSQDGDNGQLLVKLNKDLNLGNNGSVKMGNTTINNGGVTIQPSTGDATKSVSLTNKGLDNGGNKITNVAAGEISDKSTDAVNGSQLNTVKTLAGKHTEVTVEGGTAAGTTDYAGENLKLKVTDDNGQKTYDLKLSDKLSVGGKDGQDGHIGVNGADGKSGVGIDGKDGISIKGKDGNDGVTIKGIDGKDGVNGAEGHIGLNGKDGMVDIWTKPGKPGVDGNDGETMTRIVYKDPNGQEHEAATLDDGLKFGGDFGTASAVKLNKQVNVKGNATTEDDLTDGNIGVVSSQDGDNGQLLVKLNKDLNLGNNGSVKMGNTTINNGGVTIQPSTGDATKSVSLTNKGLDNGGNKITNVAAGEISDKSTDAVNGSQLNTVKTLAGQHTTVEAGSKNITVTEGTNSTGGKKYTVDLAKDVTFGDTAKGDKTVAISGTDGTITAGTGDNKVTVDGSKGQIVAGGDNGIKIGNIKNGDSSLTIYDKDGKATDKKADGGKFVTNLDNKTWKNDGSYVSGRAATEDQLHQVESSVNKKFDDVNTKIENVDKHHTEVTVNGGTPAKADGSYTDGNLQIAQKTGTDGQKIYDLKLGDNLNIGGAGKDGAPGKDGHIGINGADGKSGVGIDGKNGISIKGKDGQNGVTIKGVDGKDGTEGHIGLIGPKGADGQKATADIHVKNGQVGVDSTDGHGGKDGMDRVVYEDHNHVIHEVATMDDGMKYSGDSGNAAVKLNKNVQIYGGATEYADGNNIGVVASQDGDNAKLQVKLAKDLKGISSIEAKTITTGDTTMDNSGLTVKGDGNHKDITIHQGNVNMGGNKIEGVAPGKVSQDSTDAVNGSQLWQRDQAINGLSGSVNKLGNRINRVGAGAAALAALHPLDFDPDDKWDFAAGYGNYRGANAAAVGAYYRPNEDTMFSVGGSFGGGENMVNAGVSIKLGQGNHVSTSRVAMAKEIKDLRQNVANLNAIVNRQSALIDKLTGTNAGMIKDKGNDLFPDVPANHWAYEYVTKLKHAGILTGYPDGNFDGDRMMTRYEFAAIVYRAIMAGAASNPALNQDGTLDKLANEFSSEMKYIRIDTIAKDKNGKPTIERVRVISDAK